jgi:uncharacterized damage-inducible protein DinB
VNLPAPAGRWPRAILKDGASPGDLMSELEQILIADGAAAAPAAILEGLSAERVHRAVDGSPRTIYQELWHLAFWQQVTLDWISGRESPFPSHPSGGFPSEEETRRVSWEDLRSRFLLDLGKASAAAANTALLEASIRCPSRPGSPARRMTVREQLENLAAHNAYHLGRIVLLRQLLHAWPPPSGGYTW